MKFLFDLPNEQLLPKTFDLVEKIEDFAKKTNISELRTPANEGETAREAGRRMMHAMAKRACVEYPAETAAVTDAMWEVEDGEIAPNSIITFTKCVQRPDVMDFFISLLSLG